MNDLALVAGDRFVLPRLLAQALSEHAGESLQIREHELPWPDEPFADVAEVSEACGSEEEIIEALREARVCLTQVAPITRRVLEACPRLEFVGVSRGGPVNVNLDASTDHGVLVSNAPGRNATATAEFTIGLLLATLRRICETHASLSERRWEGEYYRYDEAGGELEHATVGVVGHGAVGGRVTRLLVAFGARVLVYDPYVTVNCPGAAQVDTLVDLLEQAQVLTLHARASEETAGMIDARALDALPDGSVLINAARGSLLDYDALFDALESGRLAGAGLDVYPTEPVPGDSRLFSTRNLVMTPHVAGASRQVAHNAAAIVAREAGRFLAGSPLLHCRNSEAGKSPPPDP
ncbi:MAG: NAD(P)-dependent oxidoreductase [Solirubrobacteraceae bacterium]